MLSPVEARRAKAISYAEPFKGRRHGGEARWRGLCALWFDGAHHDTRFLDLNIHVMSGSGE